VAIRGELRFWSFGPVDILLQLKVSVDKHTAICVEAAMLNWFRNLKTRQEPKKKQEELLACPKCKEWATKKILDQALVTPADGNLTCEICGATRMRFDWRQEGNTQAGIKQTANRVAALKDRLDQFVKPPESN
jgi:hypothetical protein